MSFLNELFKTQNQKEKEARAELRKAFGGCKRAISSLDIKAKEIEKDRNKKWQEAAEKLKAGNRPAARRHLQAVRSRERMIEQLETRKIVSEEKLVKLQQMEFDAKLTKSFSKIINLVEVDTEELVDTLEAVTNSIEELNANDEVWVSEMNNDLNEAEYADSDVIDSVDNLMGQLESEVAFEVGGISGGTTTESNSLTEDIGKAADRLRNLMEDNK